MNYRLAWIVILLACCVAPGLGAQGEIQALTSSNMPEFLSRFKRDVKQAGLDLGHLSDVKLPLLDEAGHPLGRRRVTDRRQTLIDLEKTLKGFEREPQDLVSAMTLSDQTEELADEIYDLSQIAYDNDREELAMEFTDLLTALNNDADLLQAYTLNLAAQKEREIRYLQKRA